MSGNPFAAPAKAGTPVSGRLSTLASLGPVAVAAALTVLWLLVLAAYAAGYFGLFDDTPPPRSAGALEGLLFLLAAIAPPALFFYGAMLAQRVADLRDEAAELAIAVDTLQQAMGPSGQPSPDELASALASAARTTFAEEKAAFSAGLIQLDKVLAETKSMMDELQQRETAAKRKDKRTLPAKIEEDADQPGLPLDAAPAAGPSIRWASVIRALDFPRDERDKEGFEALRETLTDRDFAELMQAAEDMLTLLSEDGLYMEDVAVDPAPVALWRRYAEGERGPEVDAIGGVRDEVALAIIRGKVKSNPVFRDAALHFLRRFDRLLERIFAELGDDPMVVEAGGSRTGRAFMLTARVLGAFDAAATRD